MTAYHAARLPGESIREWFMRVAAELDHARWRNQPPAVIERLARGTENALEALRAQAE